MQPAIEQTHTFKQEIDSLRTSLLEHIVQMKGPSSWTGYLSSSALSTATSIAAFHLFDPERYAGRIQSGLEWLISHVNDDGGWGDTPTSPSNLSTTTLCWAAFMAANTNAHREYMEPSSKWLREHLGHTDDNEIISLIMARYGRDKTFSVPILCLCILMGRFEDKKQSFRKLPALPYEYAALPAAAWRMSGLPVVSYALPALIAIGQLQHYYAPSRNPFTRFVRSTVRKRTLSLMHDMQPSSGGFLEASPLTGFVAMSLSASGSNESKIVHKALRFLEHSQRQDGSWPIDTNLETWVTTSCINALQPDTLHATFSKHDRDKFISYLVSTQFKTRHPYTNSPAGGWSWTSATGGVPDADDTSGALLALHQLHAYKHPQYMDTIQSGILWLLNLQNKDGGIPTFCKGWGKLPFDRSAAEITAHALHACTIWQSYLPEIKGVMQDSCKRMLAFIKHSQADNGCWIPLWFGNQNMPDESNAIYGTSAILRHLCECGISTQPMLERAKEFLVHAQHQSGAWGGLSDANASIEETGLALTALMKADTTHGIQHVIETGLKWLAIECKGRGDTLSPADIGLYFARLWYSEKLYPYIFALGAVDCWAKYQVAD